jgi:serine/threonine protein kinase
MVMIFAEAETLRNLHHKNIVHIKKCFTLNDMKVALVMEYLEGGELKDYILSKGKLSEEEAKDFFTQLVDAVNYCHRERVIHRDLKLENILLENKGSKVVKVTLRKSH